MSYKILDRESTVLLFPKDGDLNPTSSFQVMRVGDRGMIHSLLGGGFYDLLSQEGLAPFRDMGVKYVYAAVSPAHLRLMRKGMPKTIAIEEQGMCEINGHMLHWILLSEAP